MPPSRSRTARSARRSQGRFGIAHRPGRCKIEPGKIRPFEEVAAELKREIATERAKNEIHQRARQDRGRARSAARRSRRRRASSSSTPRTHRGDRPHRPRPRRARRCPTCRRTPTCWRRPSPPRSASRTIRCGCRGRLRLVRRRRRSRRRANGRSTRSRTRSRRAGATTRSPTRLKTKADRDARQAQGRHVVRRGRRGRQAQGRMAAGHQARQPAAGLVRPCAVDGDLPHRQGRRRQRRGREPDRADRVPRHRDQGAGARSRSRADAKRIDDALRRAHRRRPDRGNTSRGCRTTSASPSIRAR